jgi:hypothetical protein
MSFSHLNMFDRACAVLALVLGAIFTLLGVLGLFAGCSAHFTLPPVLGAAPAFVAWGVIKPILVAWNRPPPSDATASYKYAQRSRGEGR